MTHITAISKLALSQKRLASLDVFRGVTIALMILINNLGGNEYYTFLQHADWNGWTLADLVFPFFLFIVGVAIPYAFTDKLEKGADRRRLFVRAAYRTVTLFALGLFISNFPYFNLSTFRVMGVLQRIALCYLLSSLVFLFLKSKWRVIVTLIIPLAYWMLMILVPVPGYGAGVLSKDGSLAAYTDRLLLNGHLFADTWDPEGLLSNLPAVSTTLIGVLAGQFVRSNRAPLKKTFGCFFSGSLSVAIGSFWNTWFPINKNLWTSSYVAFTGGIALIILAACFFTIDVRKHRTWTSPFIILGTNAISMYILAGILSLSLSYTAIPLVFASWTGPSQGQFLYALLLLAFCWAIAGILNRKKIFIKI